MIAQLGARISKRKCYIIYFYVVEVEGVVQYFFLEFCFTYYTIIHIIYIFFLFKHKLHFCDFIFYNDFIKFHRIS